MYYKIVCKNLKSIFGSEKYPITYVQYKIKDWAYPHDSRAPLCVFSNIDHAKAFANEYLAEKGHHDYKIYECIIEPSDIQWNKCLSKISIGFCLKENVLANHPWNISWPIGTVLANKVMLIQEAEKPDNQIYYKVVCNLNSITQGEYLAVKYKINDWTIPKEKIAPLMVFDSEENAIEFIRYQYYRNFDFKIYKCHIIKSHQQWGNIAPRNVKLALKKKKQKKSIKKYCYSLPRGTIFADAVKLINEL